MGTSDPLECAGAVCAQDGDSRIGREVVGSARHSQELSYGELHSVISTQPCCMASTQAKTKLQQITPN